MEIFQSFAFASNVRWGKWRRRRSCHLANPTTSTIQRSTLFILILSILLQMASSTASSKLSVQNNERLTGQRFAMEPQDQTAVVGSRVTLPCRVIDKEGILQVSVQFHY